jgi:endonuclease/exonuclease/phosphatase family metal-dependent hydrolase
VTFNVLIGSPFPPPFVGRWAANLGSAAGAQRLQQQQRHVRDAAADIVCLQELHDCRVTRSYGAAFAASHQLVTGSHFNARGGC